VGLGDSLRPLEERRFRLLWLGRVSSGVGDAIVPIAYAFAVISINHSATALGGVLAALTIARVSFTLFGGVVADRLPRRAVMLATDLIRAAVQAFTAVMLITHNMTLPLFFVTAAIFGAASAFFAPASDGLVPQTIGAQNLQAANALIGMSRNTLNVFGPAVSGGLIALAGTGWVFAIDAVSFVVSAFFLFRLRVDPHERAPRSTLLHELRTGLHEVTSRSWVRTSILGFAITNMAFASFLVLGPIVFRDEFHGARDWGIVSTCGSVGAILGAVASVKITPRHPLYTAFMVSTLMAAPIASLAGPLPFPVIAFAWGLGMASIALANTWWETSLQRLIPAHVYSRVRSYDILVSFVFMPLGMISFGPLAEHVGYERTLFAAAGVVAATNLFVALAPAVRAVTDRSDEPKLEPAAA
jgi:MFS family permease